MSMNFATDVVVKNGQSVQTNKVLAPTASGGSTYGPGMSGQVLKSNGTNTYWGDDSGGTVSTVTMNGTSIQPVSGDINLGTVVTSNPVMTGATSSTAGTAGIVPAPGTEDRTKFLCGNGSWQPAVGSVTAVNMNNINYLPDGGVITLGTVVTSNPVMTGADGSNAGTAGLVPAPTATDNTKYLRGDGTWQTVSSGGGSVNTVTMNGTTIQPVSGDIDLGSVATSAHATAGSTPAVRFVTSMSVTDGVIEYETQTVRAATDEVSGVVSTSTQSFAGTKTFTGVVKFTNEAAASATTNGAVRISGGLGVAGYIYGAKVYNAVWNDVAECREAVTTEPGRCVTETDTGVMALTEGRLQAGCRITSDTFGFGMGETDKAKTPIAIAGRVLAYPFRDPSAYHLGDAVCSAPNGTVDVMTREEIREYPERIIGTISEIPKYDTWRAGTKEDPVDIPVNGRIWVYVR